MNLTAGTVFACSTGHPIEDLLDRNIVFEFDGLHTDVQNFLMEILFAAVYEYRVAQSQRGGDLRHVFVLDEGKRVFSVYKERQDAAGIPKVDELTAKMREFGEGLVVADQEASKLTDSIKANNATKVLFATGDTKQFAAIEEAMNLSDREAALAQQAAIGEAIVQTTDHDPVPVKLSHYELEKTVTDVDLRERQRKTWNCLSYTDRELVSAFTEQVDQEGEDEVAVEVPDDPGTRDVELSPAADTLLRDIVESPFTPPTERYDRFSSRGKGTKAKRELVEKGLIEERTVGTAPRKLFQLTRGGREYVERVDDIALERRGRGGIEHQYYQHRLKELSEEVGWPAVREAFDADVYVNMDDIELAIKVAMADRQREIEHIDAHLNTFDYVWVFCKDQEVREGLVDRLAVADIPRERVTFRIVTDIDDELSFPASDEK